MIAGIILAAGEGTRMNSKGKNKTSIEFAGKPLVVRAVELLEPVVDEIVVVVGAYEETVKEALAVKKVIYARQEERLGTGHAAKVGLEALSAKGLKPESVVIGYGDHMMFYTPNILREMILKHKSEQAALTLVSTSHEEPDYLAWGRIIRNQDDGTVERIVEQKEANEAERAVKELNAGFYCFEGEFAVNDINLLGQSELTSEYYLTDMVEIANKAGKKVIAHLVPFRNVGYGINTPEHLSDGEKLFLS